jgi:hypothetical protein
LQLVCPDTYDNEQKQRPWAQAISGQFDQKPRRSDQAGYDEYLKPKCSEYSMEKIQQDVTQPLPPQLAQELPAIPWRKVKLRQIRQAPLLNHPLSESHMPPSVRHRHLTECDGKNTSKQGKPPSRSSEALGRPFIPIDCGCVTHATTPIASFKKSPPKIIHCSGTSMSTESKTNSTRSGASFL